MSKKKDEPKEEVEELIEDELERKKEISEEELEEESMLEGSKSEENSFSFSQGILATNKNITPKRVKNLEEELEEEKIIVKEKDEDEDEEELKEKYGVKKRTEEEKEDTNVVYSLGNSDSSDFYSTGGSDLYTTKRGDELYSSFTQGTVRDSNLYTTGEVSSMGKRGNSGSPMMGGFYNAPDANKKKDGSRDKDWITQSESSSGLEDLSRKAKKVKMGYS